MSCSIEAAVSSRKAENIAAEGDDAGGSPRLQHLAVLADLVLALLGVQQIAGIDRLQPDEDPQASCTTAFLDEVRKAIGERVDLDQEGEGYVQSLAQCDDRDREFPPNDDYARNHHQ